ncbi:hypothetical protein EVAR_87250_1 [Eumeta japonica]|uniref:Uncharacterized protein n=1 Tax=Eumeta variegata TaxID=151549 RepID=A0A4C1YPC8_EUMVA|nr:hypothetical protein EVAR_87250_1 [Eumeta japonica]
MSKGRSNVKHFCASETDSSGRPPITLKYRPGDKSAAVGGGRRRSTRTIKWKSITIAPARDRAASHLAAPAAGAVRGGVSANQNCRSVDHGCIVV